MNACGLRKSNFETFLHVLSDAIDDVDWEIVEGSNDVNAFACQTDPSPTHGAGHFASMTNARVASVPIADGRPHGVLMGSCGSSFKLRKSSHNVSLHAIAPVG